MLDLFVFEDRVKSTVRDTVKSTIIYDGIWNIKEIFLSDALNFLIKNNHVTEMSRFLRN